MPRKDRTNKVKQIREQLNISQGKLVELTGLTREFLSRVENNRVPHIGLESARRISKALKTPIEEIFP